MRRARGFTLIEMLVVIAIITILAALLVVLIGGILDRSKNSATYALIKKMDMACRTYSQEYWSTWPPTTPYNGSANLHFYLGNRWIRATQFNPDGTVAAVSKDQKPFVEFKRHELEGNPSNPSPGTTPKQVIDAWGKPVGYKWPGDPKQSGTDGFDIWSTGKDGAKGTVDDIANWIKDY